MGIHHSQQKKAEKAGYTLEERDDLVRAFWPKRSLEIFGVSSSDAMAQMQAAMVIASDDEFKVNTQAGQRLVYVTRNADDLVLVGSPMPPVAAHKAIFLDKNAEWREPIGDDTPGNTGGYDGPFGVSGADGSVLETDPTADIPNAPPAVQQVERSPQGVALNGAIAYAEGTPASDCPFDGESEDEADDADAWYTAWDEAADAASEAEDAKGGSVVSEKYRAKYAEAGHPTHCGDWLAEFLNEQCLSKEGTDLARFEAICQLNGVDTSKYRREGVGWQGRLRMTGRNLLAKKVYLAGGILLTPGIEPEAGPDAHKAPAEWMAAQRFKMPKADQAKPIPDATIAVASGKAA